MEELDITYDQALRMTQTLFRNIEDAEDICQEAYYAYSQGDARGRPILYRRIIDAARKHDRKYNSKLVKRDLPEEVDMSTITECPEETFGFLDEFEDRVMLTDLIMSVYKGSRLLPIVVMRLEGFTTTEIAEQMELSQPRIVQLLREARTLLEDKIHEESRRDEP